MIINPYVFGAAFDPDAQAFITAAGITDNTQKSAINTLVVDMKGYGIWTKMKAIYPMVGGTSTTHKFNLKNPLDTNAAFRLSFVGGWTHSSNGALPNGVNGFADTFLVSSAQYAVDNNHHISYYSRSNTSSNSVEMGVFDGTRALQLLLRNIAISNNTRFNSMNAIASDYLDTNSLGHYIGTRTTTTVNSYKNGINKLTQTNAANGRPTVSIYLANQNYNGSPNGGLWSIKQCAFASIGDGLNATEAANFYTAVQAYQTTLGRQV